MTEKEMINQINSLIEDRKSFITDDKETSEVFEKDVEALKMILNKYNELSDRIIKAVEYIENILPYLSTTDKVYELLNILKGVNK